MVDNCEYFLHARDGNSFYFRHKEHPDSDMQGFTLTYMKPGYTVLTGDMGCLCWHRHAIGFDYGFPGKTTGIDYFAEKVRIANSDQVITEWDSEKARADIKEHFESEEEEDFDRLDDMLDCQCWDNYPSKIGEFKMLEDLNEHFPDNDWYEFSFGEDWQGCFKRRYEMIKSVSNLVLEAVKSD